LNITTRCLIGVAVGAASCGPGPDAPSGAVDSAAAAMVPVVKTGTRTAITANATVDGSLLLIASLKMALAFERS